MSLFNGISSGVFIVAGLMALCILFLLAMFARLYRKAGPHEALVVYGFRGTRVVKGHGTVIFPMVESCRELSLDRKSTRLNSSHTVISYAVFCLKKKKLD